jgi:hypothetical protein
VSEKRVHRRVLGLKRDEVTGGWKNCIMMWSLIFYSSPNIIQIITSRRGR